MKTKDPKIPKGPIFKDNDRKSPDSETGDNTCSFCANFRSREKGEASAGSSTHFMTERELKALKAMRGIKKDVRGVKKRLREIEEELESRPELEERSKTSDAQGQDKLWEQGMIEDLLQNCEMLYQLKKNWEDWDEERMAAAEERMRLLGHIQ